MEELNKIVAENLVNLRTQCGLTQLQVAEKINYSDKSISKWERGEALPDASVLLELSKLYNVSLDSLVSKHEKKPIKPRVKRISLRTMIFLISFAFVWFVGTIIYTCLALSGSLDAWLTFIIAIPVSFLTALVLSICWYPYYVSAIFSSIFLWTTMLAITQLSAYIGSIDMWLMYIIAIPLQLIIIFGFVLQQLLKKPQKTK